MVRKPSQLRQIVGEAAGKRSGSRRRASAAVASFGAAVLLLAGCGGSEQDTNDAADTPAPESPTSEEVIEDPNAIQRSLVGLHIEGAEGGAWASAPYGALRLWDNGTGWSQICLLYTSDAADE